MITEKNVDIIVKSNFFLSNLISWEGGEVEVAYTALQRGEKLGEMNSGKTQDKEGGEVEVA